MEKLQECLLRSVQEGYTIVSPLHYDDKPDVYFLMKGRYKERIPRPSAEKFIRENDLEYKITSNWKSWRMKDE